MGYGNFAAQEETGDAAQDEAQTGVDGRASSISADGADGTSPVLANRATFLRPCRPVNDFSKVGRISEGTYGVVYKYEPILAGA